MSKPMKQKPIILTVMIVIAIITAAFFAMSIGRNIIINSESYSAEKRFEKLTDDLLTNIIITMMFILKGSLMIRAEPAWLQQ